MTSTTRRLLLGALVLVGLYVGLWAAVLPASFHASFPGPFGPWVAQDGPYDQHLVRDVGTLHLALAAAGAVATLRPARGTTTAVALAWVVHSVPHLAYHVAHLDHLGPADAVAQTVALGGTLLLAAALLLPGRRPARAGTTAPAAEVAR
ncbi:hypothetical protein [Cellulomonas endophytica]|uniref:hypothetical protein n=1 Tax=Cellulomonas endophytica TaxID=2494735 RepID=UPI0010138177|nr:hypothetical protein [Cellulomonas endophytica]